MKNDARFNLEAAIASWRSFVLSKRTISPDDADELESHLRDEVDDLVAQGMDHKAAFDTAMERVGTRDVIESAYDRVYWKKLRAEGGLLDEFQRRCAMLKNYVKVALRNLRRHLGFTFINVVGLALGLACYLLIMQFVQHERSYDRHHERAERIFRVTTDYASDGRHWAATSPPVGPAMAEALPEIEEVARFLPITGDVVLRREDRQFEHSGGVYADSSVFDVFSVRLLHGDAETALAAPHTIVLSQRLARTIFGDADPVGETLTSYVWESVTVTGVMEDLPTTTHLPFDFMVSMATFNERWPGAAQLRRWERFYTYVLLHSPSAREPVEQKLSAFAASFFAGAAQERDPSAPGLSLQPLLDIHLQSHLEGEYRPNGDIRYVYIFGAIALFVLLIACVNFINLSTARAAERSREVGVRKALGADRGRLVGQFLGESVLLALMAVLLALVVVLAGLPLFNRLAGTSFSMSAFFTPTWLGSFLGIGLLTGLASGMYPALALSAFRPTEALRGYGAKAGRTAALRKGLVTFQFAISVFLIIATAVIYRQFQYIHEKPLGFDRDQVVVVKLNLGDILDTVRANPETIKRELKQHPAIHQASLAYTYPGACCGIEAVRLDGSADAEAVKVRMASAVDHDYLATLGISLAAGRDFSRAAPADTTAWLINRAAARHLGADEPLGSLLRWRGFAAPIVGIMEDFHFASLHNAVEPLVVLLRPSAGDLLLVRVRAEEAEAALQHIENQLARILPGQAFRYAFLNDELRLHYAAEDQLRDIAAVFSALAILIACLGLFGLAAFTAQQRTKEIGIRKVLGAPVSGIALLLAGDFLKLVAVAFIISAPVAYVVMNAWLDAFAYHAELSTLIFVIAGGLALMVALLTVSYHAARAALADPVSSLRYE